MPDFLDQLNAALADRYAIEREICAGGHGAFLPRYTRLHVDTMTKTNGSRPHLGLMSRQRKQERRPDVSVIGADMRIIGRVHSSGAVKVAGSILGDVRAEDQVLVAEGGRVEGDVFAREVVLGGEVRGSVVAEERVEVLESAVIRGDITTPRLMVHEGAAIDSELHMAQSTAVAQQGAA